MNHFPISPILQKAYKLIFILTILIFISIAHVSAQLPNPFHPKVDKLAKRFSAKYEDDSLRAIAIYHWLTNYMTYDLKAYLRYDFKVNNYSVNRNLYRRKALCYGISELYKELCLRSGTKAIKIKGYPYEDKDDAYIHYYYHNHAWISLSIQGRWFLFDPTYDLGSMVVKRRPLSRLYCKIFRKPFTYNKVKFRHSPGEKFMYQPGHLFIESHYPVLTNAMLTDTVIDMASFSQKEVQVGDGYEAVLDSSTISLDKLLTYDVAHRLKVEADHAYLCYQKNNFIKAVNYYRYIDFYRKSINKADVDTVLRYGNLFIRDNNNLNRMNNARIDKENNQLVAKWKELDKHNNTNRNYFLNNHRGHKNKIKVARAQSINKDRKTEQRLQQALAGNSKIRNLDSIAMADLANEHATMFSVCDSLNSLLMDEHKLIDSLSGRAGALFAELKLKYAERRPLLKALIVHDMAGASFPLMEQDHEAITLLTAQIDETMNELKRTVSSLLATGKRSASLANKGLDQSKAQYRKVLNVHDVSRSFALDTIRPQAQASTSYFRGLLSSFYQIEERVLELERAEYRTLAKMLKKSANISMPPPWQGKAPI